MKHLLIGLLAVTMTFCVVGVSSAFFMNFEGGLGNDLGQIMGIPGVTFTESGGLPWVYADATSNNWNLRSVNLNTTWGGGYYNMYDYVCAFLGTSGDWGRIDFDDQNGTWFQTGISCYYDVSLEAYDASDNLLDIATATYNLYPDYLDMTFLRVDAPTGTNIAYVKIHDSGNYWCADNMTGDMAGGHPIPEPSTLLLLGSGLLGLAGYSRARFGRKK